MKPAPMKMRDKLILRVVSKVFIPFMFLFGLYVQFHGDFGPGGGFQAGVVFAAGFILYGLIFGLETLREAIPPLVVERLLALGLLLYGFTGVASLFLGANFLDYDAFSPEHPMHGQHIGILLVEFGVGLTVTAAMTLIFYGLAGRATR